MPDDQMQQLHARVTELEKLLNARTQVPEVTADEMATFRKVAQALNVDVGDCGINECFRPHVIARCVVRCIQTCVIACIAECSCGPCSVGQPCNVAQPCQPGQIGGGGFSRFAGFGG